jgi:predicted TIM-barrel fold metal-dependent hydrolase
MTSARVIDADGHVLEPLAVFGDRLHTTRDSYGLDHVYAGGQEIVTVSLGKLGTPGSDMADLSSSPEYDDAQRGGFDPVARLRDMDLEGIETAVLYPSLGLNFWAITDVDAAVALARAYNDWLAQYCAADPRRLHGAAMVPWQSIDAAVTELLRAHDELGFPAALASVARSRTRATSRSGKQPKRSASRSASTKDRRTRSRRSRPTGVRSTR